MPAKRLRKPKSIAASEQKRRLWNEITRGREFSPEDVPSLVLLVQWHAIVERCVSDMADGEGVCVSFENKVGDIKAIPQIDTLKKASAEIRALNKQLGINDQPEAKQATTEKANVLSLVVGNRADKAAAAR